MHKEMAPMERIPMKRIREVVRLCSSMSQRQIAKALGIGRATVAEYIDAFKASGLAADDVVGMTDDALLERFYGEKEPPEKIKLLTDRFESVCTALKLKGETIMRQWQKYRTEYPDGYSYAQFCHYYQLWRDHTDVSMHIEYKAGDKMLIDFAGEKLFWLDPITGERHDADVFVAVLGASQYTYVEAVSSQTLPDFIHATQNAFYYFGGVTAAIVPDCLKSAVQEANNYEPKINEHYHRFAEHYQTVVLPARVRKPKDKTIVEGMVRIVYQRIYTVLRERIFHSLSEINRVIREELARHNETPMQRHKISRLELFNEIEKVALLPLPAQPYEMSVRQRATVEFNYHVFLKEDMHHYSVPYRFKGAKVDIDYTSKSVEIYCKNERIAVHVRDRRSRQYSTADEHMPPNHHFIRSAWSAERITRWAYSIGVDVGVYIERVLASTKHPEQAFKMCMGIFRLAKENPDRIAKACLRGTKIGTYSFRTIENIIKNNLDGIEDEADMFTPPMPTHENIRGAEYYGSKEAVNE